MHEMLLGKDELIKYWKKNKIVKDKRVIAAFDFIPRENFIAKNQKAQAYFDFPLEISDGQTISQPTTVVMMLDYLNVKTDSKVLEIGSGSGYNAALLSKLTSNKIISIERIGSLAKSAKSNLSKLGITNVKVIHSDGSKGYPKDAPYDRIIVTCATPELKPVWINQLSDNGIIVAPVGTNEQEMIVARKIKSKLKITRKGNFSFVPLLSGKK
jgi:protein-L-isoaspartate(D-aspartate) O-methyltransferase